MDTRTAVEAFRDDAALADRVFILIVGPHGPQPRATAGC